MHQFFAFGVNIAYSLQKSHRTADINNQAPLPGGCAVRPSLDAVRRDGSHHLAGKLPNVLVNPDGVTLMRPVLKNRLRDERLDIPLDVPTKRPRTILRIIAMIDDKLLRFFA